MRTPAKIAIVAILTVAVIGAVALKKGQTPDKSKIDALAANAVAMTGLPRLLDLGADKCIPCKMMFPVLEELKKEYAGKMEVGFIDVWQHPEAGRAFGVEVIPTQIFYDASGKELFRHVGFFGKNEILAKWRELGVDLNAAPAGRPAAATAANQVVAYYFHGTVRCETCLKIERLALETLQQRFASELAASRLVFMSVNYDQPENRSCLEQYKLPCPSLVVARLETGKEEKWKLLGETWQLVEDTNKFNQYVGNEVERFLNDPE
jgi:thioredoxin 1